MSDPTFTREQIQEWADKRADDAGRLARCALALLDRAEAAEREGEEQARLLGISGSREAKLLADLAARDRTIAEQAARIATLQSRVYSLEADLASIGRSLHDGECDDAGYQDASEQGCSRCFGAIYGTRAALADARRDAELSKKAAENSHVICERWRAIAEVAKADAERLRAALESIAANTCCHSCQEAARVARIALAAREIPAALAQPATETKP